MAICQLCSKPLRNPESIRIGYGSVCAQKVKIYQAATGGGRHAGYHARIAQQTDHQLQRALRSLEHQICLHKQKLQQPAQALTRDSWD